MVKILEERLQLPAPIAITEHDDALKIATLETDLVGFREDEPALPVYICARGRKPILERIIHIEQLPRPEAMPNVR
jgi:hypothetical protein